MERAPSQRIFRPPRQFQKISSGTYNAGEVKLASETKLGKVNNHVSRLGQNVVPLSHEEEIHVNGDDLEPFANQNFTQYDDRPANQVLNVQKPADKYTQAYFAIPQPFRLRLNTVPGLVADLK